MPFYYVNANAQSNGDHEVHETGCTQGADAKNQESLGWHLDCKGAVTEAKKSHSTANGCAYCCPDCNTG